MKNLTVRFAIAIVAFLVGVASASLWLWLHQQSIATSNLWVQAANLKSIGGSAPQFVFDNKAQPSPSPVQPNNSIKLETICSSDDSLSYRGIEVTRSHDSEAQRSTVIIRKGGRILAKHRKGEGLGGKDSSCTALFPLLGVTSKQLIVAQSSGGAHCC